MGQMGPPVCLGQIGTGNVLLNSSAYSSPLPGWLCQVYGPFFRLPPYPCHTAVQKLVPAGIATDFLFLPHEMPLGVSLASCQQAWDGGRGEGRVEEGKK